MTWFNKTDKELEQEFETNLSSGLSLEQAQEKLVKNGKNELPKPKNKHWSLIFLYSLLDPLSIILIIAGIASVVIQKVVNNKIHVIDFAVILCIVLLNAFIQTIEQVKAKKSLESLKKMTIPVAVVKRDGDIIEIPANELVVGDIVILEAGKYIPADIRILEASNLFIDEAALTGESVPIEKNSIVLTKQKLVLADQTNMAFMSTFITNGRAIGIVVANAVNSEIGKIAAGVVKAKQEKTPLQIRLTKLTKVVSIFAILLAIFVFVFFLLTDENSWPINLMTSVTIAIAVIPESLVVIVSVILSLSVKRMARVNVIVKKLDAVETLGSVNVICSDKTGTLTQNKMTVKEVIFNNETMKESAFRFETDNRAAFHFINCLTLCNDAINAKKERIGDPTEIALIDFTRRFTISEVKYREQYARILEVPFDSARKLMSTVNRVNKQEFVYEKGALDQLLKHCHKIYLNNKIIPLTATMKEELQEKALELSSQALRVLAFAFKEYDKKEIESDLIFLGAVGMIDPPRPEAVEAVKRAHEAGIRVIMITGDHKATALAIAKDLNLATSEANVISGHQIDSMNNKELQEKFRDVSVFARVNPDHKTRIVECLQAMNYVVSMTGDGVNDAPSLSKADIGVAMGITGTDVSKEAANIILQDDNFSTIIHGVEEGRNVYHKIKRAIAFVCAAQLANVLTFIIISVSTQIKPFDSVNILWFNLVVETLMAIPIGLGDNDNRLMLDKPRNKKESFFTNSLGTILYLAFVTAGTVIATFFIGKEVFNNVEDAKIATILVMACSPVIFAFAIQLPNYQIKAHHKMEPTNYYLLGASLIALALNFLIIYAPGLNLIFLSTANENKFETSPLLSWQMSIISLGMMVIPLLLLLAYDGVRKFIGR